MSILTEFHVDSNEFSLGRALKDAPNLRIELERVVPIEPEIIPFFWAWGRGFATFERAVKAEAAIDEITMLDSIDNGRLYRATWTTNRNAIIDLLAAAPGTVLEAIGTAKEWSIKIRFEEREQIRAFIAEIENYDVAMKLTRSRISGLVRTAPSHSQISSVRRCCSRSNGDISKNHGGLPSGN